MTDQADLLRNRRRLFALPGGSHDKLIGRLAKWLPAGIGAIFAVMLIAPIFPRGEISFLLDRNKVAVTTERLRISEAEYRGEDSDGHPFSVMAGNAVQRSSKIPVVEMNNLKASILLSDGPAVLKADSGSYNISKNAIDVRGPVNFNAADGYHFTTADVKIDLKNQKVSGDGGVSGAVPGGTFSAQRISADLEKRTVALEGRARLTMQAGAKIKTGKIAP